MQKAKGVRKAILKRLVVKRPYNDVILLYRLFCDRYSRGSRVYSLTVTKIDCKGQRREVCCIRDIARDPYDAARIFYIVSRGLVTPMNAREIVSDIIGIYLG